MKISNLVQKDVSNKFSISGKKMGGDFSREFESANKRNRDRELRKLLDSIKKKGQQIIKTQSITAIREYKNYIKEYLSLILEDAYRVQRLRDNWNGNPLTLVSIINEELDGLVKQLLSEERNTIDILGKIEHIEGLLIDIYQ